MSSIGKCFACFKKIEPPAILCDEHQKRYSDAMRLVGACDTEKLAAEALARREASEKAASRVAPEATAEAVEKARGDKR